VRITARHATEHGCSRSIEFSSSLVLVLRRQLGLTAWSWAYEIPFRQNAKMHACTARIEALIFTHCGITTINTTIPKA
jgi:hypothetical protein